MKEADLYPPLYHFFTEKGYTVRGEVKECDMALLREDELILVEMKLRFNLELLMQGVDRQTVCDTVYLAIPRPTRQRGQRYQGMMNLVRRLDLGLIFVAMDSPMQHVEILRVPQKTATQTRAGGRRRAAIEKEINARKFTLAVGGVVGEKIPTAYKEQTIQLLCTLAQLGEASPATLHQDFNCSKNAQPMLGRNYDGWFKRVEHGVYTVTPKGHEFIQNGDFPRIVEFYTHKAKEQILALEAGEEPPKKEGR